MPNKCLFCGEDAALVNSHIIPKGLYWGLDQKAVDSDIFAGGKLIKSKGDKHKSPSVLSTIPTEVTKRQPSGFYSQIICQKCEARFGPWDDYAVAVLRDRHPITVPQGWLYANIDYAKMKLFFLSLLWRSAVTSISFFDAISLENRDLSRLRRLIMKSAPGSWTEYSVLLWRSDEIIAKSFASPRLDVYEQLCFAHIYFPGYLALIKIDYRPIPDRLKSRSLNDSGAWFVMKRDYSTSGELKLMIDTLRRDKG